ncbi:MAG TPA: RluA family pseudouridine synthase [Phycisphaerales bacterium]|nr:RluA family pseudouridine synthase [Phycisphaerales bacterium]
MPGPLEIVHATCRYVVVNKPPGLLSVPGKGAANQDCVPARVAALFPGASGPLVVHRLDMDTSGLLVLGLDPDAQRELSRQFEAREVEKTYTALVEGTVPLESGTIDAPIRADIARRPIQVIDRAHRRPAITVFRVVAFEPGRTRLELVPLTGRTHQLRVHTADAASWPDRTPHPIVGDVLYGHAEREAERLMLHASLLIFTEPGTGRRVTFRCPVPF